MLHMLLGCAASNCSFSVGLYVVFSDGRGQYVVVLFEGCSDWLNVLVTTSGVMAHKI